MLSNIRIVLVNTSHPGNIGAAARAMKNMGLERLYLVAPQQFPHAEANARAAGAEDLLTNAVVVDSLTQAIADCQLVFATSARQRSLNWPLLEARQAAKLAVQEAKQLQVALVFGRESSGLTNQELTQCHYHLQIPTVEDFSSLNLGAAVQVVAYEVYIANLANVDQEKFPLPEAATVEEIAELNQQLQQLLEAIDFLDPQNPRQFITRWRRLLLQGRVEKVEINMLKGMLKAIQQKCREKN